MRTKLKDKNVIYLFDWASWAVTRNQESYDIVRCEVEKTGPAAFPADSLRREGNNLLIHWLMKFALRKGTKKDDICSSADFYIFFRVGHSTEKEYPIVWKTGQSSFTVWLGWPIFAAFILLTNPAKKILKLHCKSNFKHEVIK